MRVYRSIAILILVTLCATRLSAQKDMEDAKLWSGVTLEHKFTRQWAASVNEQLRLNRNLTTIDEYFTEFGIHYQFSKQLRATFNYRLISKNQLDYYSTRHRLNLDLSYRHNFKPVTLVIRERIQKQVQDLQSSDNGKIPVWYLRTKVTAKYDLNKKYTPYLSWEIAYLLDNANETDHVFDKSRYEAGFDYDFNRKSSVNIFYMIQRDKVALTTDYIIGIGYTYNL